MSPAINLREVVGRYLRKREFIRGTEGSESQPRAKRQAFEPTLDGGSYEMSVFRITHRTRDERKQIAVAYVEPSRGPQLAVATLPVPGIRSTALDVLPAFPPARHAIVVGWATDVEDHMQAALDLVNIATVELLA